MATIKNFADVPVTIGGTTIQPGKTANFPRWHILQHSDSAHQLLNAKLIEVTEDQQEEAKPAKGKTTVKGE